MLLLVLGLILFFGIHTISIVNPGWRDAMCARLGENLWKGAYSLLSLAGLVLIIKGYGVARLEPIVLYSPPVWLRHLNALLMLFVFPFLLATFLPGKIKLALKHPTLIATKIWAFSHLLVNGTLADVLLFGSFLVWAVANRISLKHRQPRNIPSLPLTPLNDVIVIVGGLALYAVFIMGAHKWLFGIAPMAMG